MQLNPTRVIFLWVALFVVGIILLLLAGYAYLHTKAQEPFLKMGAASRSFVVDQGSGARQIGTRLAQDGFIADPLYFVFTVWEHGFSSSLKAGTYVLNPGETPERIALDMAQGNVFRDTVTIIVPEGFTVSDIETACEGAGLFLHATKKLTDLGVSDFKTRYSFLADVSDEATLEGYLFPDTYVFERSSSPVGVAEGMLDNFGKKLGELTSRTDVSEIVIAASLIQKEVSSLEDMELVSGILWKRIQIGMPLQMDATVVYATGKNILSTQDLKMDSPYNTYLHKGLPPGPIANPGSDALKAALNPTESDYLFYLSKRNGETVFSTTLAEHNAAKQLYLR